MEGKRSVVNPTDAVPCGGPHCHRTCTRSARSSSCSTTLAPGIRDLIGREGTH